MSTAVNFNDAIAQLEQHLDISGKFRTNTPKPVRCSWLEDTKRNSKGWFMLFESVLGDGNLYITGSYGWWIGDENNARKIDITGDYKPNKEDQALIRKQLAEARKKANAEQKKKQEKASLEATRYWRNLLMENPSPEKGYLKRKMVGAHGVRFTKDGAVVVSVSDVNGKKYGHQFILDKDNPDHEKHIRKMGGGDKRFWPFGMKITGCFHMIGVPDQQGVILIAEGYATAASIFEATGIAVAVAFNANNILPVLRELSKHYRRAKFLICADDDYLCRCQHCRKQTPVADEDGGITPCEHCGEPHGKHNTGVKVAINACAEISAAAWMKFTFTDRTHPKTGKLRKIGDGNDLSIEEGPDVVRAQVQASIADKFPRLGSAEPSARDAQSGGAGANGRAGIYFMSTDEAIDRYSLIYGVKDTMFDHAMFKLVPKSCVMDVLPDHGWREIKQRNDFRHFDIDEVGFDPTESDPAIRCNMWGGWPTVPDDRGSCDKLLELLEYMCSLDDHPRDVFRWVLRWLAYPVQHPGSKMKTALVIHGGQGVGKNLFFEAVMAIYGEYGRVISQTDLEDRFNDWAGRKLYLIANEVIARADLFHQKNKVKGLITDDWIRINPKNMAAHDERNHLNMVFLSNESQPVVLDPDDRRFMAIWTPPKRKREFYAEVLDEIAHGGIAALHHHLLNLDLGDFDPGTPPLTTRARTDLIELGKESPDRFIEQWLSGELDIPSQACALSDIYIEYDRWCRAEGERFSYAKNKFSAKIKINSDIAISKKPVLNGSGKPKVMRVVLPSDDPKPDTEAWMKWLGARVQSFRDAVKDTGGFA